MATIGEIATHAEVPVEGVLRVINGERVGEDIERRVAAAMQELGPPHPALANGSPVERAREQMLESVGSTPRVQPSVSQEVSTLVYEALRVEVGPFTQHVGQMSALLEELRSSLEQLRSDVWTERNERLDDLTLLVDLIVTGWQSVDRRLARLERAVERNGTPRLV